MKKLSLMLLLPSIVWAGGHNVNQEQNTVVIVSAQPGPQGPSGAQGVPGLKGPQGDPGQDYDGDHRLTTNIGADIQWYDWEHASIHSGYRYDFNHKGHVVDIGVVTVKIGKSYENRKLADLEKKLDEYIRYGATLHADQNKQPSWVPLKSVIRGNQ